MVTTEKGALMNNYFNYENPVQPGDRIESSKYNGDFAGIGRAFDTLPSPDDLASNVGNYARSTGTATAYAVSLPKFDGSFGYIIGMQVLMMAHIGNTGAATLNVNGVGAKPLVSLTTGNGPLVANDLKAGAIYDVRYDGTQFQITNTVTGAIEATKKASQDATTAAANAATYATNAKTSETNSAASASSASGFATTATNAANTATTQATAAAGSASTATTQAANAATQATNATTQATNAATSATNAATSASTATTKATAAAGSATAAAGSATTATTQATNAANSAAAAANSISDASFRTAVLNVLKDTVAAKDVVRFFSANIDPNTQYPGTTWTRLQANVVIRTANATGSDVMTTGGADSVTLAVANLPAHSHTGTVAITSTDLGTKTASTFDYGTKTTSTYTFGNLTSSTFDYGTKTSSSYDFSALSSSAAGAHSHTFTIKGDNSDGLAAPKGNNGGGGTGTGTTSSVGNHTHTLDLPSHAHTVGIGAHNHTVSLGSHTHTVGIGAHAHTVVMGGHSHTVSASIANTGSGAAFSVTNPFVKLVAWRRTA